MRLEQGEIGAFTHSLRPFIHVSSAPQSIKQPVHTATPTPQCRGVAHAAGSACSLSGGSRKDPACYAKGAAGNQQSLKWKIMHSLDSHRPISPIGWRALKVFQSRFLLCVGCTVGCKRAVRGRRAAWAGHGKQAEQAEAGGWFHWSHW